MAEPDIVAFSREIIDAVKSGRVKDRDQLQNLKLKLCKAYGFGDVPPNSDILANVTPDESRLLTPFLVKKPTRTISGVAVVAVMTSPHDCPHGRCSFCPGGVQNDSPQSYTGKEPAARRAGRNMFDPWMQVTDRVTQLTEIGHKTVRTPGLWRRRRGSTRPPPTGAWGSPWRPVRMCSRRSRSRG